MNRFLALYRALDQTTSQQARLAALTQYFREEDPHEAAWVVYLLRGGHLRRFVSPRRLREWIAAFLDLPLSLIEAAYQQVGDLAETLALLLPNRERPFSGALPPLALLAEKILPHIATLPESAQQAWLAQQWEQLSFWEAYLLHKLLLGGFRVGVAEGLLIAALAEALELPPAQVAARLSGALNHPSPSFYEQLRTPHTDSPEPYPFFLAYPIEELGNDFQEKLGSPTAYQIEWKWDGVRVQLVRRSGKVALWSRGGVPLTEGFPDVVIPHQSLPDGTVLDGELVILRENQVQPFAAIQRRLLRKKVTPALLRELPAALLVYDLLALAGEDLRERPLSFRRAQLEALAQAYPFLRLSPQLSATTWEEVEKLRTCPPAGAEGLMLKHRESPYLAGRRRGYWWKYKRDPFAVDAVLVYAQRGHGRRSGWFSDLTFALWNEAGQLVTFAKAYSGLTDPELRELTRWIRTHATEKIGPIVKVPPVWVFTVAFEGIQPSARHKCGYAVRFPRIVCWRRDKKPEEADTLHTLRLLAGASPLPTRE